jgi:hypothetical protein
LSKLGSHLNLIPPISYRLSHRYAATIAPERKRRKLGKLYCRLWPGARRQAATYSLFSLDRDEQPVWRSVASRER